jgi:hypothetical protein
MVDPNNCPTKHYWKTNPDIHRQWKYYVVGGNHGARAKKDLYETYKKNIFAQVEAWVYAGLTPEQIRVLAWQHNIDQEYRKTMTNIDKIRAIHALFLEANMSRTKELKYRCCAELGLKVNLDNRDSLSKYDPMFQIAFRTGEIWDLQDKIFTMWINFETLGQKKAVSPVKKGKQTSRPASVKKLSGELNLVQWRALQGINGEAQLARLLRRVVNRSLSLEGMAAEGDKIKKLAKVKRVFLQISGQTTWEKCREMFPEETEGKVLASWADRLADQVENHLRCFDRILYSLLLISPKLISLRMF